MAYRRHFHLNYYIVGRAEELRYLNIQSFFCFAGMGGRMSNINKTFEELDVIDDFLMNAVATDPEVGEAFCRTVLSVLLQKNIRKLHVAAQKTVPAMRPELRGIRMDVEIMEEIAGKNRRKGEPDMNIYDLEPHLQKGMNFPKHNRFYQAKIDSRLMKSGERDFSKLPNLFVLTITNFDVFGKDYMMYRFWNHCEEVPELKYEDGLQFIYFYTNGTKGGNEDIKAMLRYLQKSTKENATDEATKMVHEYVSKVKILPEVRENYMRFDELMEYAKEKGWEEGMEKGMEKGRRQTLIELLELYGEVPEELEMRLQNEEDVEKLRQWCLLAAKVQSVAEFIDKM